MEAGDRSFRIALNEMRHQSMLCDVTLTVDDHTTEMAAHRAVLAASSPFFRAMFNATATPSSSATIVDDRVPLAGISATVLADIIAYLYTGDIQIGGANVHGLLEAATLLQLPALRLACADTLSANLTTETCLRIHRLAERHGCDGLLQQTDVFIQLHWAEVRGSEDFGRLLGGEPLAEPATTLSFEAQAPPPTTAGGIDDDQKSGIVQSVQAVNGNKPQIMTVVGQTFTAFYDFEDFRWTKTTARTTKLYGNCAFEDNHKICIINNKDEQLTADLFNTTTHTWELGVELKASGRVADTYALLNGVVYAMGGDAPSDTVDWFDTRTDRWQSAASMATSRYRNSVIVMDGLLYAVGGYDGNGRSLKASERYDAAANSWESIAPTSVPRGQPGLCVLNGLLYAVGGYSSDRTSVEAYDPASNTWHKVASMSVGRYGPGVVAHAGELYVMSGTNDRKVEVYCPATNTWRALNASLPESSAHLKVCVHDRPEREKVLSVASLFVK